MRNENPLFYTTYPAVEAGPGRLVYLVKVYKHQACMYVSQPHGTYTLFSRPSVPGPRFRSRFVPARSVSLSLCLAFHGDCLPFQSFSLLSPTLHSYLPTYLTWAIQHYVQLPPCSTTYLVPIVLLNPSPLSPSLPFVPRWHACIRPLGIIDFGKHARNRHVFFFSSNLLPLSPFSKTEKTLPCLFFFFPFLFLSPPHTYVRT
ncbi:hypothetical protein F5X96DRAFT_620864 [Biscogniauxia mediterranea]|nr:hypothetical protein F5X96DRAFT_620864 [Biscogniauxia mediterranea]